MKSKKKIERKKRGGSCGCSAWLGPYGRALQPVEIAKDGVARFKSNAIVRLLLDDGKYDMNRLALLPFSDADREQFAQLIGYSVCGFNELSYVSDAAAIAANEVAEKLVGPNAKPSDRTPKT